MQHTAKLLVLAAVGWLTASSGFQIAEAQVFIPVNPKSTFLSTDSTDTQASPPVVVDLAPLGIRPGTVIRLRSVGAFFWAPAQKLEGTNAVAIFSTSTNVLGAIPSDAPAYITAPTFLENLPTDIAHDFLVDDLEVTVPPTPEGSTPYLLIGADDVFWGDNTDPNNDFGVEISSSSTHYFFRVLTPNTERATACGGSNFSLVSGAPFAAAKAALTSPGNFGLGGVVAREAELLPPVEAITGAALAGADVVILPPIAKPLSPCEQLALRAFAEQGGGVFVIANQAANYTTLLTDAGPASSCGGGTFSFTTSVHPTVNGPFGLASGSLGGVFHCRFASVGPNGVTLLTSSGPMGAAFEVGKGRVVVINDEEWLMSSGGCPSAPFWGTKSQRLWLNSIAWLLPSAGFQYQPSPTGCFSTEYTSLPGCSSNPATLSGSGSSTPLQLALAAAEPNTAALLFVGTPGQDAAGCGLELPPFGELLLQLFPSPIFLAPASIVAGTANWSLALPPSSALLGVELGFQVLAVGPTPALSTAVSVRLGW